MSESTFLSQDEIKALTKRVVYKSQAKQLNSLRLTYRTRADGTHVVLRSHVEKELGGVPTNESHNEEPNWNGLDVA